MSCHVMSCQVIGSLIKLVLSPERGDASGGDANGGGDVSGGGASGGAPSGGPCGGGGALPSLGGGRPSSVDRTSTGPCDDGYVDRG